VKDPERLSSSSDDALRSLLEAGKSELPNHAQLASLAAKLGPVAAGGAGAAAVGATKAGWLFAAKGVAALVVAGGVAVAGYQVASTPRPQTPPLPSSPVATATVAVPSVAQPDATPHDAAQGVSPEASSAPTAAPRPASPPKPSPSATPPAEDEAVVLSQAQRALAQDPATSLRLADDYARRYPGGFMRQEAEVIAVTALVRLGRDDEAQRRGAAFRRTYPTSSHLQRIDALLGRDR
jgi:hypothetical protein